MADKNGFFIIRTSPDGLTLFKARKSIRQTHLPGIFSYFLRWINKDDFFDRKSGHAVDSEDSFSD